MKKKSLTSKKWKIPYELEEVMFDFQIEALNLISRYINSNTKEHALIKMPTGTGKTLLIAATSNFYSAKNILVLTASRPVKEHLIEELRSKIWEKFNLKELIKIKKVIELFPRNAKKNLENNADCECIYLGTIKTIYDMKINNPDDYEHLKKRIDLIIFDEGHKEPAEEWSSAVRDLNSKVILFTATPIRNDKRKFNINKKFIYNLPFNEAIERNMLRAVRFSKVESKSVNEYVEFILSKYEKFEGSIKVIFRFGTKEEILIAYQYLKSKKKSVIAIHEEFSKSDYKEEDLVANVPKNIREKNITYWLHQNKLIEGIDDNTFQVLCIYKNFSNVRGLVQQIGRVLRNSSIVKSNSKEIAYVYYSSSGLDQEKLWFDYCFYEEKLAQNKELIFFEHDKFLESYVNLHPEVVYLENTFTKRFEEKRTVQKNYNSYKVPLRTTVLLLRNNSTKVVDLLPGITQYFADENIHLLDIINSDEDNLFVAYYVYYNNSPFLSEDVFLEIKTGLLLIKIIGSYLFIFNSKNNLPNIVVNNTKRIDARNLEKLFSNKSKFSQISISNSNISANVVSRSVFYAEDMTNVVPNISDAYKFATTVNGTIYNSNGIQQQRYVGFKNSKISDSSYYYPVDTYIKWLEQLSNTFNKVKEQRTIFDRYAPITNVPENTEPTLIMFNFREIVGDDKELFEENFSELTFDSNIYTINNNSFKINDIDGKEIIITVTFDETILEYALKIEEEHFKKSIYNKLLNSINLNQDFKIVPKSSGYIYSQGYFYKLGIDRESKRLQSIFREFQLKEDIVLNSEKGESRPQRVTNNDIWDNESLFYLIASRGRSLGDSDTSKQIINQLEELDYIICSDLDNEIADFIGIKNQGNNRKVYFIHCKAKKYENKVGISASSFQDICGQIIKNIDFIHPLSTEKPNINLWDQNWTSSRFKVERKRIMRKSETTPQKNAEQLWQIIKDIQEDQEGEVYVWALVGNMFSLEKFLRKSNNDELSDEYIPFIYLLCNTWSMVQETGAKFQLLFNKISVN